MSANYSILFNIKIIFTFLPHNFYIINDPFPKSPRLYNLSDFKRFKILSRNYQALLQSPDPYHSTYIHPDDHRK